MPCWATSGSPASASTDAANPADPPTPAAGPWHRPTPRSPPTPNPTTRLNHPPNQTGKPLYALALLAFAPCPQLLPRGLSDSSGTMQALFVLGVATVGIGLPVTMIAMGHQLRAAAKLPAE